MPRISIVVPAPNDKRRPAEALQSLAEQDYPGLEVIVQDARSIGEALDLGFARAGGEILGYLGAEERMLPCILHEVAAEMDPARGRHVVMGRSAYVVEGMERAAIEQPGAYRGRFDHLTVWKKRFDPVPRPSVFWHRKVAEHAGNFAGTAPHALDYDLICRLGAHCEVHNVDRLWGIRWIEDAPIAALATEPEMLDAWIEASRRHWGSWLAPLRWRCEASYRLYLRNAHEQARHHARQGEDAAAEGRRLAATIEFMKAWASSPAMARARFTLKRPR